VKVIDATIITDVLQEWLTQHLRYWDNVGSVTELLSRGGSGIRMLCPSVAFGLTLLCECFFLLWISGKYQGLSLCYFTQVCVVLFIRLPSIALSFLHPCLPYFSTAFSGAPMSSLCTDTMYFWYCSLPSLSFPFLLPLPHNCNPTIATPQLQPHNCNHIVYIRF
jgi:hypothetical protein